ncbi:hypothetical protein BSU04_19915 [Caballeronia sordidicola]|uniref:Uncharacterized protein n=1 Tax=Caballeronia sordidicola TaxID=196367 RepID=A0A226X1M8_CABSO|nr:hypothetical protein BSU04_19915 [Caballeronia sordidicola]
MLGRLYRINGNLMRLEWFAATKSAIASLYQTTFRHCEVILTPD